MALDGRTTEARVEKRTVRDLTEQIGGDPTPAQRILITRAARLLVLVEQIERSVIERKTLSDHGGRQVVALINSLRLTLVALGLERPTQQPASLKTYLGGRAA